MATVRIETTRGPTYSLTRAIVAIPWQKGFNNLCCLYSPLKVEVTRKGVVTYASPVEAFATGIK